MIMANMPDVPRNKMSLCSRHNLEEKRTFWPRKDQYRPVLEGKIKAFTLHIGYLPWPDPIRPIRHHFIGDYVIGAGDGAAEPPVNHGRGAPGDTTDDVLYRIRTGEGAAFPGIDVEGLEAVKEVAPRLGPHFVGDDVVGTGHGSFLADGSVQNHFGTGRRNQAYQKKRNGSNELNRLLCTGKQCHDRLLNGNEI